MTVSISTPVQGWRKKDLAQARYELLGTEAQSAVRYLLNAVNDYKLLLVTDLTSMEPSVDGAKYAQVVGKITALEEVPQILQGLLEEGERAEDDLRQENEVRDLGS